MVRRNGWRKCVVMLLVHPRTKDCVMRQTSVKDVWSIMYFAKMSQRNSMDLQLTDTLLSTLFLISEIPWCFPMELL